MVQLTSMATVKRPTGLCQNKRHSHSWHVEATDSKPHWLSLQCTTYRGVGSRRTGEAKLSWFSIRPFTKKIQQCKNIKRQDRCTGRRPRPPKLNMASWGGATHQKLKIGSSYTVSTSTNSLKMWPGRQGNWSGSLRFVAQVMQCDMIPKKEVSLTPPKQGKRTKSFPSKKLMV